MPQEWLAVIREYGGDMKETYGVPFEEIKEGIRNGVRKVNIDTDIRLAMTGAMRRAMAESPSVFDPRAFLKAAQGGHQGAVRDPVRGVRLGWLGEQNQARVRSMRWPTATRAGRFRPREAMLFYGGCAPATVRRLAQPPHATILIGALPCGIVRPSRRKPRG